MTSDQERRLEDLRRRFRRAAASASEAMGSENAIHGLLDAVEALPDRTLLRRLPFEVRNLVEFELNKIFPPSS